MIFLVWFLAVIVSLAPQFGWKDPEYLQRIEQQKCMVSQDISYQRYIGKFIKQQGNEFIGRRPRPIDVTANNNQPTPQKKKTRLKIRLASKFTSQGKSAVSSLGLVEGNSTNTVNTVEDTEYSSNVDSKKGIEVTAFTNADEGATSSTSQISTVSHLVALANQTSNEMQKANQNQLGIASNLPPNQELPVASTAAAGGAACPAATTAASPTPAPTPAPHSLAVHTTTSSSHQGSNQVTPVPQQKQIHQKSNLATQVSKRKETLEAKRERKAAKTLAIITGAFVVCWLPFFLMALLLPLCESCHINDMVASLFLWLGYFNSTLNPVIYTIFSPEFRQAFKRILCGTHRPVHYRSGKI
ncbi:unnamed protein product [Hermetia illucens]|uniref:G-protein coupled receptors family 1 profile domain-containing protein n=1 Tax=Hermetia illucens TaxID=343691 RepID=A0A7R8UDA3_HERIL|nr:unnamed protein product [Hermetia illucens]